MAQRPNILFILSDQQSATMMSCAGNPYLRTPAMDGLAATGVRFERAYCTNPVCIPSRFSLLTGLLPSAIGMVSNQEEGLKEFPAERKREGPGFLMRSAGYEPIYAGKEHLPRMTVEDLGFENPCKDERDALADFCVDFLRRRHKRPFFLAASFINPHDICYMAIRDSVYDDRERGLVARGGKAIVEIDAALARPAGVSEEEFFAKRCPPLPPNFEPQADEPEAIRLMLDWRPFREKARREWSRERWREHRWAYCRLTERVDGQIGRVLDALRESGEADRTLIVFTSDHGDMDSSHRMEHKSTLYEEDCRIPFIVRPPGGSRAGRVENRLVSNGLDLLPTFCDYAGIPAPSRSFSRSLKSLVEGDAVSWRESLPVESSIGRGVFTERFKYARYDVGANAEQLGDLVEDPHEMRNSLAEPRHREAVEELRKVFDETFGGPRDPEVVLKSLSGA